MTSMKYARALVFGLAIAMGSVSFSSQALAQKGGDVPLCNGEIMAQDEWVIRYDPHVDPSPSRLFQASLINNGGAACPGQIIATSDGYDSNLHAQDGSQTVPFSLVIQDTGQNITPRVSNYDLSGANIAVPPGQVRTLGITFSATPGTTLMAGRYTQEIMLEFISQNGRGTVKPKRVVLVLELASSAIIGLKGEFIRIGGMPTVNLGELQTGPKALNTEVYVRATAGYLMTVTSLNGGELRHDQPGWAIDYGLKLGSNTVDLTRPYQLSVPSTQARSDDYPLTFTIGDVEGKRAGRYTDTLRFTIAAI